MEGMRPPLPHKSEEGTPELVRLIWMLGEEEMSATEMLVAMGLKHRQHFTEAWLRPALNEGVISRMYPDVPRHPNQKFRLTKKGCRWIER